MASRTFFAIGQSDEIGDIGNTVLLPRDETGIEVYYKPMFSRWFELTADLQLVEPAIRVDATTAVVAGVRANFEF